MSKEVSEGSLKDWDCLLYGAQGKPAYYAANSKFSFTKYYGGKMETVEVDIGDNPCRHMVDDHDFLAASLFCEWAYIINVDTGKLEVYKGFNVDPEAPGRYAALKEEDGDYRGVKLVAEFDLDTIGELGKGKFCQVCGEE